jgi:antitoxin (DNA-binding transcriptional repressor) of toxin-antitoxin stability system
MSEQVNIYDAKTRLSQLVDRAEAGEEIIIVSRDFDAPLPADFFDGEE